MPQPPTKVSGFDILTDQPPLTLEEKAAAVERHRLLREAEIERQRKIEARAAVLRRQRGETVEPGMLLPRSMAPDKPKADPAKVQFQEKAEVDATQDVILSEAVQRSPLRQKAIIREKARQHMTTDGLTPEEATAQANEEFAKQRAAFQNAYDVASQDPDRATVNREFTSEARGFVNSWMSLGARMLGQGQKADEIQAADEGQRAAVADIRKKREKSPEALRMVMGGVRSAGQMLPGAVAGVLGGPGVGLGVMSATFGGQEWDRSLYEAEKAGLSGARRQWYAATQGGIEASIMPIFSKIPGMGGIESRILAKNLSGKVMKRLASGSLQTLGAEALEEVTTEVLHDLARAGFTDTPVTSAQLAETITETLKQTAVTVGMLEGTSRGSRAATDVARAVGEKFDTKRSDALVKSVEKKELTRSEWARLSGKPKAEMPKTPKARFEDPAVQTVLKETGLVPDPQGMEPAAKITEETVREQPARTVEGRTARMGPGLPTEAKQQVERTERTLSNEDFAWEYLRTPEGRKAAQRIVDGRKYTPPDLLAADPELGDSVNVDTTARRTFFNNVKAVVENEDLGQAQSEGFASEVKPDGEWRMLSPTDFAQVSKREGIETRQVGRSGFVRYTLPKGASAAAFPSIKFTADTADAATGRRGPRAKRAKRATLALPDIEAMRTPVPSYDTLSEDENAVIPPEMRRLYRGGTGTGRGDHFTTSRKAAQFYADNNIKGGSVSFVDVPATEIEQYRGLDTTLPDVGTFDEYRLPRKIADQQATFVPSEDVVQPPGPAESLDQPAETPIDPRAPDVAPPAAESVEAPPVVPEPTPEVPATVEPDPPQLDEDIYLQVQNLKSDATVRRRVAGKNGKAADPAVDDAIDEVALQLGQKNTFDEAKGSLADYVGRLAGNRFVDAKAGREQSNVDDSPEASVEPDVTVEEQEADSKREGLARDAEVLNRTVPTRQEVKEMNEGNEDDLNEAYDARVGSKVANTLQGWKGHAKRISDKKIGSQALHEAAGKVSNATNVESLREAINEFSKQVRINQGEDILDPVQPVGIRKGQTWISKKDAKKKIKIQGVSKTGRGVKDTGGRVRTPEKLQKEFRLSDDEQEARKPPATNLTGRERVVAEVEAVFGEESAEQAMDLLDAFASTRPGPAIEFWNNLKVQTDSLEDLQKSAKNILYQSGVENPVWYSKLQDVIEAKIGGKVGYDQLLATLKKNGVKPEEIEWSNLEVLFEDRKSVPKDELQAWVTANGLKLDETVLGARSKTFTSDDVRSLAASDIRDILAVDGMLPDELEDARHRWAADSGDIEAYDMLDDALIAAGEPRMEAMMQQAEAHLPGVLDNRARSTDTKFGKWTLEGGENYREVLIQLPSRSREADAAIVEEKKMLDELTRPMTPAERTRYSELTSTMGDGPSREARAGEGLFTDGHWDQPNVVVHIRMSDRIVDGKKVLHIEEIQSDWHQRGRKKGYQKPVDMPRYDEWTAKRNGEKGRGAIEGQSGWDIADEYGDFQHSVFATTQGQALQKAIADSKANIPRVDFLKVPNAPFKKSWHELAMKRVFQEAVDGGYDSIIITPGKEQAKRYDLSQQVDNIDFRPVSRKETAEEAKSRRGDLPADVKLTKGRFGWDAVHDDGRVLFREMGGRGPNDVYWSREDAVREAHQVLESRAGRSPDTYSTDRVEVAITLKETPEDDLKFEVKPDGTIFNPGSMATSMGLGGKSLEDVVGKAVAQKIMADKKGRLSGEGLSIGGEGMTGFYDQIIPRFVRKYGKKWGITVGTGSVPTSQVEDWTYKGPDRTAEEVREAISRADRVATERQLREVESAMTQGGHTFRSAMEEFGSIAAAEVMGGTMTYVKGTVPVHRVEVTDAMRKDIGQKGQPLFQGTPKDAQGAFIFDRDTGMRIITAFETGNVSTLAHEMGHLFRSWLTPAELADATRALLDIDSSVATGFEIDPKTKRKVAVIDWDNTEKSGPAEELFVKHWESFLKRGKAPRGTGLKTVFEKFQGWLVKIADFLKTKTSFKLNKDLANLFNRILGGKKPLPPDASAGRRGQIKAQQRRAFEALKRDFPEFDEATMLGYLEQSLERAIFQHEEDRRLWRDVVPDEWKRYFRRPKKGQREGDEYQNKMDDAEEGWRSEFGRDDGTVSSGPDDWSEINMRIRDFVINYQPGKRAPQIDHDDVVSAAADLLAARRRVDADERNQDQGDDDAPGLEDGFHPEQFDEEFDDEVQHFMGLPIDGSDLDFTEARNWFTKGFKRQLFSAGLLPEVAHHAQQAMGGYINRYGREIAHVLRDFKRAWKKRGSYPEGFSKKDQILVHEVLRGEKDENGDRPSLELLPEPMRDVVGRMRNLISSLQRQLLDSGAVDETAEQFAWRTKENERRAEMDEDQRLPPIRSLREIIEEDPESYLNRSYAVFTDPKHGKRVLKRHKKLKRDAAQRKKAGLKPRKEAEDGGGVDVVQRFKDWLRETDESEEGEELTDNQVDNIVNTLLFKGKAFDRPKSALGAVTGGQLGAKDIGIITKKKRLPFELRELWGEHRTADVGFAQTVTKIAALTANHKFLKTVKKHGMGKFLFEGDDRNIPAEAWAVLSSEGNPRMTPLDGLKTFPELKQAFEDVYQKKNDSGLLRLYYRINAAAKIGKTVLSPMTHPRNFLANPVIALANGNNPLRGLGQSTKMILADIGVTSNEQWREHVLEAIELKIVDQSARGGELEDMLEDATFDPLSRNLASRAARGLYGVAAKAYQIEDDFWKLHGFINYKRRYGKAHPEMSKKELAQHVAPIIRNTYPTYGMVSRFIKNLRRWPVGSFVSFPAEMIRISYHQMNYMAKEITSDNPGLRKIGFERLAGMTVALGAVDTAAHVISNLLGLQDDDWDDIREFVAPWSEESTLMPVPDIIQNTDKKRLAAAEKVGAVMKTYGSFTLAFDRTRPSYIDTAYTDPYAIIKKPFAAFIRGEDWKDRLKSSSYEILEPFFSEEMVGAAVVDVLRNKKGIDGGPVVNENLTDWKVAYERMNHVWKALEPGFISQGKRFGKAWRGEEGDYGQVYTVGKEIAALIFGMRVMTTNVRQSLSFDAGDFKEDITESNSEIRRAMKKSGNVSDVEIAEAYSQTDLARRNLLKGMHRKVEAAMNLSLPESEIKSIFKLVKMSVADIKAAISGDYKPYEIQRSDLDGMPPDRVKTYRRLQRESGDKTGRQQAAEKAKEIGRLVSQAQAGTGRSKTAMAAKIKLRRRGIKLDSPEARRGLRTYEEAKKLEAARKRPGR